MLWKAGMVTKPNGAAHTLKNSKNVTRGFSQVTHKAQRCSAGLHCNGFILVYLGRLTAAGHLSPAVTDWLVSCQAPFPISSQLNASVPFPYPPQLGGIWEKEANDSEWVTFCPPPPASNHGASKLHLPPVKLLTGTQRCDCAGLLWVFYYCCFIYWYESSLCACEPSVAYCCRRYRTSFKPVKWMWPIGIHIQMSCVEICCMLYPRCIK